MPWLIAALYTLIIVCIGLATVVEKYHGTAFVSDHIYGSWWFAALWAVLTVAALTYIFQFRMKSPAQSLPSLQGEGVAKDRGRVRMCGPVLLLHLSFVVILVGALVTHLFAERGAIRLRTGQTELAYVTPEGQVKQLPFSLTLKEFRIINYPGTDAPLDYQSIVSVAGASANDEVVVSMNHIGSIRGYRLFQQSYDTDGEGVTLGINHDPFGIAITYSGYLMLLIGIIATLLSRKTQMRALYRKAITAAMLLFAVNVHAATPEGTEGVGTPLPSVDKDIAHRMGTICVLYNDRICPLNTVATDFTMKLTGSASWNGYSADEVFFSWMIYYDPWEKSLTPSPSPKGEGSGYTKEQRKAAEKRAIVEMFYSGQFTKIFPYKLPSQATEVTWFTPGAQLLPREIPVKEQFFIKQSMDFLTEAIVTGQRDRAFEIIAKIKLFQRDMIGDLLPSDTKISAELFYNKLRSIKFPVLITLQLGLRWWLSGHVPLSNGYEIMLFMAWVLLMLTIALFRKFRVILWIGPLAALCCMLVAMMSGSGSDITPLMPVLQSPLLSLHVMTVMCAYALFALQMFIGLYVLIRKSAHRFSSLTALSQLLLYPAVFLLTIGIFLGAVWANISWGNYWSWDPKESWALITLMVYAVPLHKTSIRVFQKPTFYHLYIVLAFLAVIITYVGVNFLLGGMHSYA